MIMLMVVAGIPQRGLEAQEVFMATDAVVEGEGTKTKPNQL